MQSKYPKPIKKAKINIGPFSGEAWFDRWHENIWFHGHINQKYGTHSPVEVRKASKQLKLADSMLFIHKVCYQDLVKDLLFSDNPFLKKIK